MPSASIPESRAFAALAMAARMSPPGHSQARLRPRQSMQDRSGRSAGDFWTPLLQFRPFGSWTARRAIFEPPGLTLSHTTMRQHGGRFVNHFLPATGKISRQSTQIDFVPGSMSRNHPQGSLGILPRRLVLIPMPERFDLNAREGQPGLRSGSLRWMPIRSRVERHDDDASIARSTVPTDGIHSLD